MELSLTPQQIAALQDAPDQPVPVVNSDSQERYYLVSEPLLLSLQGLTSGPDAKSARELEELIQQGLNSPEIPAEEAFDRLRKHAQMLARGAE